VRVRESSDALAFETEHVEHHVRERNRCVAMQHALADQREVRLPVAVERDELAVEDRADR
jgi:hypothetical protein